MADYQFHVLGSRGSRPVSGAEYQEFGGATSCYIIRADDHAVVLDCGTGLYEATPYLAGCTQVDVLMTHLHYDHILGLLNWAAFPKEARVRVYAGVPKYSKDYNPADFLKPPYWPVSPNLGEAICVGCDSTLHLTERVSARFAPSNHPDNATIIRVDTDNGAVCLCSDFEHGGEEVPAEMTEGCDFILYDGMFNEMEYPVCRGWGHSTWQEGVKLVKERNVPKLMITHHLPERTDEQLRQMEAYARQSFADIRFVRAGDVYTMAGEMVSQ